LSHNKGHALERIIGRNSGGVSAFIIFIAVVLVVYKAQEEELTAKTRTHFGRRGQKASVRFPEQCPTSAGAATSSSSQMRAAF
jgi:hypothetical protein